MKLKSNLGKHAQKYLLALAKKMHILAGEAYVVAKKCGIFFASIVLHMVCVWECTERGVQDGFRNDAFRDPIRVRKMQVCY